MYERSLLCLFTLIILTSCGYDLNGNQKQEENFSKEKNVKIKSKAKFFSNEELQNGEVPLYEYIQLSGEIIKSDSKNDVIEKGDRFILKQGENQYQIINEQEETFIIGDQVIVYGEYYGFVKAHLLERRQ